MSPDLFSSFDPAIYSLYLLCSIPFWIFLFSPLFTSTTSLWAHLPMKITALIILLTLTHKQTLPTQTKFLSSLPYILPALFSLLISINFLNMTPYLLSLPSHLIITVSLGLPFWLSILISGVSTSILSSLAHLLPSTTPPWLCPPLTLIETTSISVRPLTISLRLSANMSAPHIILILASTYLILLALNCNPLSPLLMLSQSMYLLFEAAICTVQAYIFFLLLTLYTNDHPMKTAMST